jgi:hypothetical protein
VWRILALPDVALGDSFPSFGPSSGLGEKANDLIVVRRMKDPLMHCLGKVPTPSFSTAPPLSTNSHMPVPVPMKPLFVLTSKSYMRCITSYLTMYSCRVIHSLLFRCECFGVRLTYNNDRDCSATTSSVMRFGARVKNFFENVVFFV